MFMLSLDGIVEFSESARPAIPTHKHAQRIEEFVGVLAMMTAVVIVHGGANVITTSVAIIATKMFASSGGGGEGAHSLAEPVIDLSLMSCTGLRDSSHKCQAQHSDFKSA